MCFQLMFLNTKTDMYSIFTNAFLEKILLSVGDYFCLRLPEFSDSQNLGEKKLINIISIHIFRDIYLQIVNM